jgi:hypothetical protein
MKLPIRKPGADHTFDVGLANLSLRSAGLAAAWGVVTSAQNERLRSPDVAAG